MGTINLDNIHITDAAAETVTEARLQECFAKHASVPLLGWEKTSGFPVDPANPGKGTFCIITVADGSESVICLASEAAPALVPAALLAAEHFEQPVRKTAAERLDQGEGLTRSQAPAKGRDHERER